jgi:tricorn protease
VRTYQRAGPGWSGAPLAFEARMELDRVAERRQVFMEFWRSVATGFYDPAMHGVDWQAMRDRYVRLLDGTATAEEFAFFVLAPLAGELNASHIEVSPPAGGPEPETASLGLAFDETYAGPGLKVKGYVRDGPNGSSTPTIKPGEFILSIGGVDVAWNEMLWNALSGRADKDTELVVNTKPDREGSRIVKLKPVSAQRMQDLEYEQEVREAREQTDKLSGGKAAYVRIRSMDGPSLRRMERELWGMAQAKSGLILDIRGNGGGSTHDAILAQLARTSYGYTQPRDGARSSQPWRHWNKPIVLMVDENSASDSEILAMGFRHLKLGKIVGERTPGYVIGTYSATLQDGTSYRVPMWRWLSAQGGDLENVGVAPDVTVERTGTDAASDEQLRAAVMLLLKELPKE